MRRFSRSTAILALAAISVVPADAAEPARLDDKSIAEAVVGRTIAVDTPIAVTLPVTFHEGGRMTGEAGALAFYLGSRRDEGKWWITKGRLCQRWQNWLSGDRSCMTLARDGRVLHWASEDGKTGTATITHQIAHGRAQQPDALGGPGPTLERDRGRLDGGIRIGDGKVVADANRKTPLPQAEHRRAAAPDKPLTETRATAATSQRVVPPVRRSKPEDRQRLSVLTAAAARGDAERRSPSEPPVVRARSAAAPITAPLTVPVPLPVTAHGRTMYGVIALAAPAMRASRWCHAISGNRETDSAPALLWHVRASLGVATSAVTEPCMSGLPAIVTQGRRAAYAELRAKTVRNIAHATAPIRTAVAGR